MEFEKRFYLSSAFLFFGLWFCDFCMASTGIHSPFHWFYHAIQFLIYYAALAIYYAAIIAAIGSSCALVAFAAFSIYKFLSALKSEPSAVVDEHEEKVPRVHNTVEHVPDLPKLLGPLPPTPLSHVITLEPERPNSLTAVPLRPRLTEEEVIQETLRSLKRRG